MVIGKGLIAQGFDHFKADDSVCVFASGVSNSSNVSPDQYLRERDTILKYQDFKGRFIYFGTTGVYDPSRKNSDYINHKLAMEQLIADSFLNWTIIRLPNVVGNGGNPRTMINYFKQCLKNGEQISIQKNASRHILDIDDISALVTKSISQGLFENEIVNFCPSMRYSVISIVQNLEQIYGLKAAKNMIEGGGSYEVPNTKFMNLAAEYGFMFEEEYLMKVLRKY